MSQPITITVDTARLVAGIRAAMAYTKRTMPQMINTSAYFVANAAFKGTPSVNPATIDSELGTLVIPTIGRSGKALKNKGTFGADKMVTVVRNGKSSEVPLAVLIIQARSNPSSKFNQLTGGAYALPRSPFKGFNRSLGNQKMAALIDKMIKRRHQGVHFLAAGWLPAIQALAGRAGRRFMRGATATPGGGKNATIGSLGSSKAAVEGGLECYAMIENAVGTQGKNAKNHNAALLTHGTVPLQEAMDGEGERNIQYGLRKMHEELQKEVGQHWK